MKTKWLIFLLGTFLSLSLHAAYVGIHGAAASGNVDELKDYLVKDPTAISARNGPHRTPLCIAAMCGQTNAVVFLLEHGANVNDRGFMELTPLADMAMYGTTNDQQCAEIATILLAHGAEVDPIDRYKVTPLIHALEMHKTKLAHVLLEHGAKQDFRINGTFSGTPLHQAVRRGDKELVETLLKFHPPLKAVDNEGATPLSLAEQLGKTEIAAMIRQATPEADAKGAKTYTVAPTIEAMRSFGQRIANGNEGALKELSQLANKLYGEITDYQKERTRVLLLLGRMHATYDLLGDEAGNGNAKAFEALKQSLQERHLTSFAPDALGRAAAAGNKEALQVLLDYKKWNIDDSTVNFALSIPAKANVEPAVDYFIDLLTKLQSSERDRQDWQATTATNALVHASAKGNQKAQAALQKFKESSSHD